MKKKEFLSALSRGLSRLPRGEREERVNFYREMIDDRIEEGIPEEEAVAGVGTVDGIVAQVLAERPAVASAPAQGGSGKTENPCARAHLRFSTISCIACGAEHGDREVVKRHGDHLGVLLRTTE